MSIDRETQWENAKKATLEADAQWRKLWQIAYDGSQGFGKQQPTHKGITEIAMSFTQLAAYIPVVRATRKAEAAFRDMAEAVAMREKAKKMASRKQWHIEQNKTVLQQMVGLLWRYDSDYDRHAAKTPRCKQEIKALRGLAQKEDGKDVAWHVAMTDAIKACSQLKDLSQGDWHVITCSQVILDATWVDGITS